MATEYLTKPDIDMILESLRYTKEAFQKYQGSTRRVSPSKNASTRGLADSGMPVYGGCRVS